MIENLTPREREVLQLIAAGRSTKALAADLGIAFKTAACHRATILAKLGAANTADLVCRAVRMGLVNVQPPVEQHDPPAIAMRIEALQTAKRSAVENLRVALDQTRVLIFETARARDLLRRAREELRTPGRPPQTDERAEFVPHRAPTRQPHRGFSSRTAPELRRRSSDYRGSSNSSMRSGASPDRSLATSRTVRPVA